MVLRNGNGFSHDMFEGSDHSFIGRNSTLEKDVISHLSASYDTIEIVMNNRVAQARHQVFLRSAALLMMDEVRFHKYRAALTQSHGSWSGKSQLTEFLL